MRNLLSLTYEELAAELKAMGQPAFRAGQVFTQLHRGAKVDEMYNLPTSLRVWIGERHEVCKVERLLTSGDGTRKMLFEMEDGARVEGVLMRYHHGATMCLSTQVGCRMGCVFCASTIDGCARNLTSGEMEAMLLEAHALLDEGEERIGNLVLMGSGEPLDNLDEVLKFLRSIHREDGYGMGWRHISLSTCGLLAGLRRFAAEQCPVTLCISLHAPDDALRQQLIPAAKANPLQEILAVCREYIKTTGRRVIFEYTLIEGMNDAPKQAQVLAKLLRGIQAHVNLIALSPVPERNLRRPSQNRVHAFCEALKAAGCSATLRRSLGEEIQGACGQLRRAVAAADEAIETTR